MTEVHQRPNDPQTRSSSEQGRSDDRLDPESRPRPSTLGRRGHAIITTLSLDLGSTSEDLRGIGTKGFITDLVAPLAREAKRISPEILFASRVVVHPTDRNSNKIEVSLRMIDSSKSGWLSTSGRLIRNLAAKAGLGHASNSILMEINMVMELDRETRAIPPGIPPSMQFPHSNVHLSGDILRDAPAHQVQTALRGAFIGASLLSVGKPLQKTYDQTKTSDSGSQNGDSKMKSQPNERRLHLVMPFANSPRSSNLVNFAADFAWMLGTNPVKITDGPHKGSLRSSVYTEAAFRDAYPSKPENNDLPLRFSCVLSYEHAHTFRSSDLMEITVCIKGENDIQLICKALGREHTIHLNAYDEAKKMVEYIFNGAKYAWTGSNVGKGGLPAHLVATEQEPWDQIVID